MHFSKTKEFSIQTKNHLYKRRKTKSSHQAKRISLKEREQIEKLEFMTDYLRDSMIAPRSSLELYANDESGQQSNRYNESNHFGSKIRSKLRLSPITNINLTGDQIEGKTLIFLS